MAATATTTTHHRRPVPQAAPAGSAEAWRERQVVHIKSSWQAAYCAFTRDAALMSRIV